ncbi:MAG: hybrid sensor histidine kinase/response regulator [Thermodesulfobacteriota bacterium]
MEEKAQGNQSANVKERLFDLLVHDLSGPLSIASMTTKNLLYNPNRYGSLTDEQTRMLDRILRNLRKSERLLKEMVEILRSEEGLFKKEFFSIEQAVRDSLLDALEGIAPILVEKLYDAESREEFQNHLQEHGIFIEVEGKYYKYPFCHDREKIQQILRNLISNALKYRTERVKVRISGETDLLILVEDDGIGIPPSEQELIFERFVRLNDEKHSHVTGLGLGLTGVKALVEAMEGEIKLASAEGAGTKFMVRIPPIQSNLNGKRILAVDDEPDVLEVLEDEILGACPKCQFDKATSYEATLDLLKSQDYDLLILDIMGVQGYDLLALAVKRGLPVAMLTAHALSPEALKRCIEMGARAYLPKEKVGEIIPFLEDVLAYDYVPAWKRLYERLKKYFDSKFEIDWEEKIGFDWK